MLVHHRVLDAIDGEGLVTDGVVGRAWRSTNLFHNSSF